MASTPVTGSSPETEGSSPTAKHHSWGRRYDQAGPKPKGARMTTLLILLAALTAAIAAARSTWSPCGLSMLSSITPLAEQGRGHRYRATACWFVAGGLLGGVSL